MSPALICGIHLICTFWLLWLATLMKRIGKQGDGCCGYQGALSHWLHSADVICARGLPYFGYSLGTSNTHFIVDLTFQATDLTSGTGTMVVALVQTRTLE